MLIALDGYNFIKQSPELRRLEEIELQRAREGLIDQLARYRRLKGHSITVVFDGWQQARMTGHREQSKGIKVIFSKAGEKADDVLRRLAAEMREGILIVTSDREVASFAGKKGSNVISAADFEEKMEMAGFYDLKGGGGEEILPDRPPAPDKKGPSRRLSKSKRKGIAAAKKL